MIATDLNPPHPHNKGSKGGAVADKAEKEITRVLGHPEPLQY